MVRIFLCLIGFSVAGCVQGEMNDLSKLFSVFKKEGKELVFFNRDDRDKKMVIDKQAVASIEKKLKSGHFVNEKTDLSLDFYFKIPKNVGLKTKIDLIGVHFDDEFYFFRAYNKEGDEISSVFVRGVFKKPVIKREKK